MAEGAATPVAVDFVAKVDGMAVVDFAGTRASTAAEDSRAAGSVGVTGSTVAAMVEASTAVVVAASIAAVAVGSMAVGEADPVAAVAAPTAVAVVIDSR